MKKKNIVIITLCLIFCFTGVILIFQRYQSWTDQTVDRLISQNLAAYTELQTSEVVSGVTEVQATLKTVAELIGKGQEEGKKPEDYRQYLNAISENESIHAGEVSYFDFGELHIDRMGEQDKEFIRKLSEGESVLSGIFSIDRQYGGELFYGVAEPVKVNGRYTGFVRGLIEARTLIHSSQTGIFKENTESYLIHSDGSNAMLENLPKKHRMNMLDVLEKSSGDKKKIEKLRKKMPESSSGVLDARMDGEIRYISYSRLPYNDLLLLNISDPVELNSYTSKLESNGQRMLLLLIGLAVVLAMAAAAVYYMTSKEKRFELRRTELLVNFSDTILCEYDIKRDILRCTSNLAKLFAMDNTSIRQFRKYVSESDFVYPDDVESLAMLLELHLYEGEIISRQIRLKGRSGAYIWCRLDIAGMVNKKEYHLVIKVTDISKEKEKEFGLLRRVQTDSLTGILSRETFEENVKKRLECVSAGYMILMDLDNFKDINDIYGHAVGDKCLKKVGEVLGSVFRSEDLAGRYGGDEFFAFIEGDIPVKTVQKRLELLSVELDNIQIEKHPDIRITCSMGVSRYSGDSTYDEMLSKADEAMYMSKKQGKNSWTIQ